MELSPDAIVIWQWKSIVLNATILYTWLMMAGLVLGAWWVTRRLSVEPPLSRAQNLLEVVLTAIRDQIRDIIGDNVDHYLPFIGTLFLFISVSNLLGLVPGFHPPTGSLSTTAALATCVFFAVPIYGIAQQGVTGYFKHYLEPSPFMLPFHVMGELSRTLALAVRLFGNVMSGSTVVAILLSIVPLFVPVVMQLLELLIGQIQAYIFAVLTTVYIASALQAHEEKERAAIKPSKGAA
ncbi:MAG: F0F1 ATP synthase subunit A [Anaerolineae bacterium]|nr:F0F1 ATP synthase subunit A [Anaerolineae bacterium]